MPIKEPDPVTDVKAFKTPIRANNLLLPTVLCAALQTSALWAVACQEVIMSINSQQNSFPHLKKKKGASLI